MGRQLLAEKALSTRDAVELLIELVYIVAKVRTVIIRGLFLRVMGQFADRVEFLRGLAMAPRHCADSAEHTASHTAAGSDEAAYGGDPQRIVERQGAV